MRCSVFLGLLLAIGLLPAEVPAQKSRKKDLDFVKARPAVGDLLPELTVSTPDGNELSTASLRGHYTVLTFGCLT